MCDYKKTEKALQCQAIAKRKKNIRAVISDFSSKMLQLSAGDLEILTHFAPRQA